MNTKEPSTQPLLVMKDVCHVYGPAGGDEGQVTLDNVNLEISAGELVAVMGRSGSGKTTLVNVAGASLPPTSGSVKLAGVELMGAKDKTLGEVRRKHVGQVYQDLNLIPALTIHQNVALPLELDGVGRQEVTELVKKALAEVDIAELGKRYPDDVSGGQKQRAAIARALVGSRQLLVADEPTAALDSQTADDVLALLRDRCDDGAAVLLVTHEARLAAWADRTVKIVDGKVHEE